MGENGVAAGRRIAKLLRGEEFSPPGVRMGVDRRTAAAVAAVAVAMLGLIGFLALRPGPSVEPVAPQAVPPAVSPVALPSASAGGAPISVYVVGQVRRPGVVSVPAGARVVDVVDAAGGPSRRADLAAVNLARKVSDGEQVVVPRPGEVVAAAPGPSGAAGPGGSAGSAGSGGSGGLVNLNTATEAEFDSLPGVGPVIAGKIVAWRTGNGRFATVDDLKQVSGIGDATMARLRPLVTV